MRKILGSKRWEKPLCFKGFGLPSNKKVLLIGSMNKAFIVILYLRGRFGN